MNFRPNLTHFIGVFTLLSMASLLPSCKTNPLSYTPLFPKYASCDTMGGVNFDGRYSLGADGKNITYSWFLDSATWSTSYFVINVDGKYGSNYPAIDIHAQDSLANYLTGDLEHFTAAGYQKSSITYYFEGVEIIQVLSPVTKKFLPLDTRNRDARYYQISYHTKNLTDRNKRVGLRLIWDTALEGEDNNAIEPVRYKQGLGSVLAGFRKRSTGISQESRILRLSPKKSALLIHKSDNRDVTQPTGVLFPQHPKAIDNSPDDIFIGDFYELFRRLWHTTLSNAKHTDSGVSFRWNVQNLPPQGSRSYQVFMGLYYPEWGRRVFKKYYKPVEKLELSYQLPTGYLQNTYLDIYQDSALIGDVVDINWNIHKFRCCPLKFSQLQSTLPELDYFQGETTDLMPCKKLYHEMSLILEKSKVRAVFRDSVMPTLPNLLADKGKTYSSGRFNLGLGGESLLFGFPFPSSTSHLILKVEDLSQPILDSLPHTLVNRGGSKGSNTLKGKSESPFFATNAQELIQGIPISPHKELTNDVKDIPIRFLNGILDTVREGDFVRYSWIFPLHLPEDSLYISQTITPCNEAFQPISNPEKAHFFHISYDIRNVTCEREKGVGLSLVLDPSINSQESDLIWVDRKKVRRDSSTTHYFPKTVELRHESETDTSYFQLLFDGDGTPPDVLYNTSWQGQRNVLKGKLEDSTSIHDRALYMKWTSRVIEPVGRESINFFVGTPHRTPIELKLHKAPKDEIMLWYDLDNDSLISGEVKALQQFLYPYIRSPEIIEGEPTYAPISHFVIEGFTGSLASYNYNLDLAERRVSHAKGLLESMGIPKEKILTKISGEYYASKEPRQRQRNNERMVLIRMY